MMPSHDSSDPDRRHIAITGASGLIGRALAAHFRDRGDLVYPVTRRQPTTGREILWGPRDGHIDSDALSEVDIVIHLAAESLFGLWTAHKKEAIVQSRVQGTALLARTLAGLDDPPRVFVSVSAVGFYGDTGPAVVDETAPAGQTFLADVCQQWETACQPAVDAGIRTVNPRLGVVLSPDGGALQVMLRPFKWGLGGRVGRGTQYMSWIAIDDVVRGMVALIDDDDLSGPVNLTSPNPAQNAYLTDALGDVLDRPTFMKVPAALVKIGAGEMGREMLLNGQRAVPRQLHKHGFDFRYPDLRPALQHALMNRD